MDWIPNVHPPATALPLAFCLLLLVIECIRLRVSSERLLFTRDVVLLAYGAGVLLAFFSGYHGSEFADLNRPELAEAVSVHHTWGKVLLFVTAPLVSSGLLSTRATYYQPLWHFLYAMALLCAVSMTVYTGWLGGELVFSLGAGVAPRIP